jgi:hypothetical protein
VVFVAPTCCEEQHDGYRANHEELPDVSSCTLIRLGRRTVECQENQYDGEGTEGHCHGKESARVLQNGK